MKKKWKVMVQKCNNEMWWREVYTRRDIDKFTSANLTNRHKNTSLRELWEVVGIMFLTCYHFTVSHFHTLLGIQQSQYNGGSQGGHTRFTNKKHAMVYYKGDWSIDTAIKWKIHKSPHTNHPATTNISISYLLSGKLTSE